MQEHFFIVIDFVRTLFGAGEGHLHERVLKHPMDLLRDKLVPALRTGLVIVLSSLVYPFVDAFLAEAELAALAFNWINDEPLAYHAGEVLVYFTVGIVSGHGVGNEENGLS